MADHKNAVRRVAGAVAFAGGTAVIATGLALAGAGTASADNQHNVLRGDGNKVTPGETFATRAAASDPGTDFLVNAGTFLSNVQIGLGTVGTNAQQQLGTAGTNFLINSGTAASNGQQQLGTAGPTS